SAAAAARACWWSMISSIPGRPRSLCAKSCPRRISPRSTQSLWAGRRSTRSLRKFRRTPGSSSPGTPGSPSSRRSGKAAPRRGLSEHLPKCANGLLDVHDRGMVLNCKRLLRGTHDLISGQLFAFEFVREPEQFVEIFVAEAGRTEIGDGPEELIDVGEQCFHPFRRLRVVRFDPFVLRRRCDLSVAWIEAVHERSTG